MSVCEQLGIMVVWHCLLFTTSLKLIMHLYSEFKIFARWFLWIVVWEASTTLEGDLYQAILLYAEPCDSFSRCNKQSDVLWNNQSQVYN